MDGNSRFMTGVDVDHKNKNAKEAFDALQALIKNPTKNNINIFYQLFLDGNFLYFVDQFLRLIMDSKVIDLERVEQFAGWLAVNSPDRGPVKIAIAILGIFFGEKNKALMMVLGRHEEFTLYAAVALANTLKNAELELWELAQHVKGWGRIQIVERLVNTQNKEIKRWMLIDGYKNSVMYSENKKV